MERSCWRSCYERTNRRMMHGRICLDKHTPRSAYVLTALSNSVHYGTMKHRRSAYDGAGVQSIAMISISVWERMFMTTVLLESRLLDLRVGTDCWNMSRNLFHSEEKGQVLGQLLNQLACTITSENLLAFSALSSVPVTRYSHVKPRYLVSQYHGSPGTARL